MTFLLSTQNVIEYLINRGFCQPEEGRLSQIKSKSSKNFNLLVSFPNVTLGCNPVRKNRHLLVKQEPHNRDGKTDGDFAKEWQIYQWLENNPKLSHLRRVFSEAIDFDRDRSVIIFNYLDRYGDLSDFYEENAVFSTAIAAAIGNTIASVHRSTLNAREYKDFLFKDSQQKIEKVKPEIFSHISQENLTFLKLYQRYDSLKEAIAELKNAYQCSCLIHNDLKLDNILLHLEWEKIISQTTCCEDSIVRIIDWELFTWGDPGFDLGKILASYLKLWLRSLTIAADIDLETALQLATTPLELLQPSMAALIKAYFHIFPEIIELRPDFFKRVLQFTGLALLKKVWVGIHYHEPFTNSKICMLQVAKTLLCNPQIAISTVFGLTEFELMNSSAITVLI
jgi:serine/threonine protein kinase